MGDRVCDANLLFVFTARFGDVLFEGIAEIAS
jgi:hypothetical protein